MSNFPYPGLRPFRKDETDVFFGREGQVDQLLEKLERTRFLAVLGPSGCGKSSLLKAGMLASIEAGFMASAGVQWRTATMTPGHSPMRELAKNLLEDRALGPQWGKHKDNVACLQAILRRGPLGLVEVLKETPLPKGTNLLILVDQFEEIFRYRQQHGADEAEAFVSLLLNSARQREVPVYVVIAMRTDFLGDCNLLSGLPEAINEGQFLIPRLDREQSRAAIVGPAGVFGGKIEPALVNRLLNDMQKDPDQLPLMQHALMRMWNIALARGTAPPTLSLGDYEAIGSLERALSNHADEAFGELDEKQKVIAQALFRSLSERSLEKRDTRRPTRLSEAAAVAGVDPEEVVKVVEVFRQPDRSFLLPPAGTALLPETIIDISHESLINRWNRLNGWVEAEADSARRYRRLVQTARLWKEGEAELWSRLDLQNTLAWKERQHPTAEWARRYGTDFDLAMEFLDESQRSSEEEKKREREAQEREMKLKQTRHRLVLAVVVVVIALGLTFWALSEREKAREARDLAQQVRKERTYTLFDSYLKQASLLARSGNYEAARKILDESRGWDSEIQLPGLHRSRNLLYWFTDFMGSKAAKAYGGLDIRLFDIAVSPDGHLLAAVGEGGTVVLFDADSGEMLRRMQAEGHEFHVWGSVAFHPDGKRLITAGDGRSIMFWALPGGEKLKELQAPPGRIWDLALSPDGKRMATGGTDRNVTIWDVETGKIVQTLRGHTDAIQAVTFSPDGNLLASASSDMTVMVWDMKKGTPLHLLQGHTNEVSEVAFSPDSLLLATGSEDNTIRLWDMRSGVKKGRLQGHDNQVYGLAFINSRYLASASYDRTLRIWDIETSIKQGISVPVKVLQGHAAFVNRITAFHDHLFSASDDGTVRRWDLPQEIISKDMQVIDCAADGIAEEPRSCAIAPDGSTVAVGFSGGGLRLYTLPDTRLVWEKAGTPGITGKEKAGAEVINRLIFSPDGRNLASASYDNPIVSLWQVSNGQMVRTFKGHQKGVAGIAFSPDSRFLATASLDGIIGIFEIGRENGRFYPAHKGGAYSVNFDKEGQRLLSAGEDGRVRLWDISTWPPVPIWQQGFPVSRDKIYWAVFSPDGSKIGAVGRDTVVYILKASDGRRQQELIGHESTIYCLAFSPDAGQVATVSQDPTVRLWDMKTEKELFALHLPTNSGWPIPVCDFAFYCSTPLSHQTGGDCWIAVPLIQSRKLVLYHISDIYD